MLIFPPVWVPDRRTLFGTKVGFLIVISVQYLGQIWPLESECYAAPGKILENSMRNPLTICAIFKVTVRIAAHTVFIPRTIERFYAVCVTFRSRGRIKSRIGERAACH